jgi:tetratricopeptide (TPR) repeat protein
MSALGHGYHTGHRIYWCNVYPEHEAEDRLAPAVLDLFRLYEDKAFYVPLGHGGSDAFMAQLYGALAPHRPIPPLLCDPLGVFGDRLRRLKVDNVIFADAKMTPAVRKLPLPELERPAVAMLRSMLGVLGAAQGCFGSDAGPDSLEKSLLAGQAQSMLERGFALALSGHHEKAIQLWSRIVASTTAGFESMMAGSCGVEAANYIGVVHCRTGRFDLAVTAYNRAQELVYGAPYLKVKTLTHLGVAHNHLGQMELAKETLSRAIAIWENHPPAIDDKIAGRALAYRGLLREWAGERSIAQEDFARAQSMKQLSDECRQLLGLSATQ